MQQVRIDFDNPGLPQSLGVVEGESQSRIFQAALYKSGAAYTAPAGAVYSIMYRGFGPQNQGWYDTIEDGAGKRAACTVSGNVVTCELARQALRVPGHLTVVLCVSDAKGYMLKSWPIMADVRNDGYEDTGEIEMYFNLSGLAGNYLTQLEKAMADAEATKNNLISTSTQAQKEIDAKAAETLKTIPESYTELDESVKQLKEDLINFAGFDYREKIKWIDNEYVKKTGEIATYANWKRTDYIDVRKYNGFTISTNIKLEYACWYDENKEYIAGISPIESVQHYNTAELGRKAYIVMSVPNTKNVSLVFDVPSLRTLAKDKYIFNYYNKAKCPNYVQKSGVFTLYSGTEIKNTYTGISYYLENDVNLIYDNTHSLTSNFLIFNSDSKQFSLVRYTHTFLESESIIGQVSTYGSGWTIGGLTIDGAVANLGKVGFSNLSDELLSKINSAGEEPVQTSWAEKYEEIKTAMGNGFTFAVQTDTHYYTDESAVAGYNLKQLTNNVGLDFACNLGDILEGYDHDRDSTENMRKSLSQIISRYITGCSCPMLFTIGNHETNSMYAKAHNDISLLLNEDELYARIIAPSRNTCKGNMKSNGRSNYYYYDFDDAKIRIIMLNSTDGSYKSSYGNNFIFSDAQVDWFSTTALNTEYAVIVMCHTPLLQSIGENAVTNSNKILEAIKTFKNKGKTAIGCFYGHTHSQSSLLSDGIWHITFLNGIYNGEVVMIDQINRKITTIALNSGDNRAFEY